MAMITLDRTWLTLVSTGVSMNYYTGPSRTHESSQEGTVQRLAGGRYRAVGTLGLARTQTFALRLVSLANLATLETWVGNTVLIRDSQGRKMYGVFWSVPYTDIAIGYFDVSLTCNEISYAEDV